MRIALVHNSYASFSGEEMMLGRISGLLQSYGHEVFHFFRSSQEIGKSLVHKAHAFFAGIYSPSRAFEMNEFISRYKPDLIQVQNVYPLISPSVLVAAHLKHIPIVMRCANYRLICPNGLFMTRGKVCQKCSGGHEWQCVLRNCEKSLWKSTGYALRNYMARKYGWFRNNVNVYIAQTEFQKRCLVENGYDPARIRVLPNMIEEHPITSETGSYVAYVGRISREKGLDTLINAASLLPDIPIRIAGSGPETNRLKQLAGTNVQFMDFLQGPRLDTFFANARLVVLCSTCFEGFPSAILEAMSRGKPVICSKIGGLPEIVEKGKTGFLFEPGNAEELASIINDLWNRSDLISQLGQQASMVARQRYSPAKYYSHLMEVYAQAIDEMGHTRPVWQEPDIENVPESSPIPVASVS
ncbi:MAG: glycosyltransferase family 4 protein [Sedimentisphaerales bacterium]|nr:glycosyltransferase family 4 protein [Sedimentisphaerales bacterium]